MRPSTDEPLIALVDLDGTITEHIEWCPVLGTFGEVKDVAKQTLLEMKEDGWEIIIYTSRHWIERDHISAFLTEQGIPFDCVICGKPLGTIYIDDKAVGHKANWKTVRNYLNMSIGEDMGFC